MDVKGRRCTDAAEGMDLSSKSKFVQCVVCLGVGDARNG